MCVPPGGHIMKKNNNAAKAGKEQNLSLSNYSRLTVKFENSLNGINKDSPFAIIGKLKVVQSDIFMAIIAQFWEKQSNILHFSSNDLRRLIRYNKSVSEKEFADIIQSTFDELQSVFIKQKQEREDGTHMVRMNLFQVSDINETTNEATVQISPAFVYLFNNFTKETQFTRFSLLQYINITSKYTKNLFRLLKEKRVYGHREFTPKELKEYLSIPKSYSASNIQERILKRAYIDLSPDFEQFHITKEYGSNHKIKKYSFKWKSEARRSKDIYDDKSISETIAMYFINSNKYMTDEQKDQATDKYFNLKKGTTKKRRLQKESYFTARIDNHMQYAEIVKGINRWTEGQLKFMTGIYSKLNNSNALQDSDKTNLKIMQDEMKKRGLKLAEDVKVKSEPKYKHAKGTLDFSGIRIEKLNSVENRNTSDNQTFLRAEEAKELLPLEEYDATELNEILSRYTQFLVEKPNGGSLPVVGDISTITQFITKKHQENQ